MQSIMELVRQVAYYFVFATLFLELVPNKTYKRCIKGFIGLGLLILVLQGVGWAKNFINDGWLWSEIETKYETIMEQIEYEAEIKEESDKGIHVGEIQIENIRINE